MPAWRSLAPSWLQAPGLGCALPESLDAYDTVVLCYPNWCGDMPVDVYTFLKASDFTGKAILPLCTNEGSGVSGTGHKIAAVCPGAHVAEPLSLVGHEVERSDAAIRAWLHANL